MSLLAIIVESQGTACLFATNLKQVLDCPLGKERRAARSLLRLESAVDQPVTTRHGNEVLLISELGLGEQPAIMPVIQIRAGANRNMYTLLIVSQSPQTSKAPCKIRTSSGVLRLRGFLEPMIRPEEPRATWSRTVQPVGFRHELPLRGFPSLVP